MSNNNVKARMKVEILAICQGRLDQAKEAFKWASRGVKDEECDCKGGNLPPDVHARLNVLRQDARALIPEIKRGGVSVATALMTKAYGDRVATHLGIGNARSPDALLAWLVGSR